MKLLAKTCLLGVCAGLGATALYAQPGGAVRSANTVEMMSRAQVLRETAGQDLQHTIQLQSLARRQKDVIKLNCVNDKLVQIKPQVNIMDRAQIEFSAGNPGAAWQAITSAANNVHRLREQADECVGEGGLGPSSSNGFEAPTVPDDPYNDGPGTWGTVVEPPAYASPFT